MNYLSQQILCDVFYCIACSRLFSSAVSHYRLLLLLLLLLLYKVNCLIIDCFVVILPLQKVQERWYEKLHEWEKALSAYERQQEKNPDDTNFLYGRMRCLEALGEWWVFVKRRWVWYWQPKLKKYIKNTKMSILTLFKKNTQNARNPELNLNHL